MPAGAAAPEAHVEHAHGTCDDRHHDLPPAGLLERKKANRKIEHAQPKQRNHEAEPLEEGLDAQLSAEHHRAERDLEDVRDHRPQGKLHPHLNQIHHGCRNHGASAGNSEKRGYIPQRAA